jgi:hypothetical protein
MALRCGALERTLVIFGGYDSYIEEFFPMLLKMRDDGWTIVAFEGPGQGTPLEESKTVMTPDWDRPVAAVLNAFGLDDVTLLGISLSGCLVMRATANEPSRPPRHRLRHSGGFLLMATMPPALRECADKAVNAEAQSKFDLVLNGVAANSPILEWGLKQGQHVFGCKSPSGVFVRGRDFHTRDVSARIRQHVLLMAGTHNHAVVRDQVFEQGRLAYCRRFNERSASSPRTNMRRCSANSVTSCCLSA